MHTMSELAAQPLVQPSDDIPAADGPPQYPALPPFEGRSDTMPPPTQGGAGALRPSVGEVSTTAAVRTACTIFDKSHGQLPLHDATYLVR